jgi:hypothetical protein
VDSEGGYSTPEEAARGDIPPQFAQISRLTYSASGEDATVWLLTNDEPYLYPYTVCCFRDDEQGRWHLGSGWSGHVEAFR